MDNRSRRTTPGGDIPAPEYQMPINTPGMPGNVPQYRPGPSPGYENPYVTVQDYYTPEQFNALPPQEKMRVVLELLKIGGANEPTSESVNPPVPSPAPTPMPSPQGTPESFVQMLKMMMGRG